MAKSDLLAELEGLKDRRMDLTIKYQALMAEMAKLPERRHTNYGSLAWHERKRLTNDQIVLSNEITKVKRRLSQVHQEIEHLVVSEKIESRTIRSVGPQDVDVKVTDHALVRWLGRVHGVDTQGLKRDLFAASQKYVTQERANAGGIRRTDEDGVTYVVDPVTEVVVTVFRAGIFDDETKERDND